MHRIDTTTAVPNAHGTGKNGFTDGTVPTVPPTQINASWFDNLQEEIANVIETAGIALTSGSSTQLLQALYPYRYGDGSDGNVTISSGTTTLTRDMYYNNLTISGTGSINTVGYRIYVNGILDISAAPALAIQPALFGSIVSHSLGAGGGGGSAGAAGASITPANGGNGGSGALNGAGGGPTGAGGTVSNSCIVRVPKDDLLLGASLLGAGAGGGGGATGSGSTGGTGGTGGGVLFMAARTINRSAGTAAGAISAAGINAAAVSGGSIGGGGGGGGGGGWLYLQYQFLTGTLKTNLISASGGSGASGGAGSGAAGDGGQGGGAGLITIIGGGTVTVVTGSSTGTSGGAHVGTTPGAGGAGATCVASL